MRSSGANTLAPALRKGMVAIRANLIPAFFLWMLGVALIGAYYGSVPAREAFGRIAALKFESGYRFSAVSTALFGGLFPFLFQWFSARNRRSVCWTDLAFYMIFWGYKGVEIDAFYRLQAWLFGEYPDLFTVVTKVFVDQFIYCPILAVPVMVVLFSWKDQGYPKLRNFKWHRHFFSEQIVPVLLFNWVIWIPSVAMLYCFPLALQLPVQNLVLCLWSLMVVFLIRPSEG